MTVPKEELKRCEESVAYWFNHYCVLMDKKGNELPKPHITDEQINNAREVWKKWKRIDTRTPHLREAYNKIYIELLQKLYPDKKIVIVTEKKNNHEHKRNER